MLLILWYLEKQALMFKQFKLIDKTSSYKSGSSIAGVGVNSKNLSPEEYKSLIFNSGSSQYLNRTPASAGNRKTWTWSGWVKKAKNGTVQQLFNRTDLTNYTYVYFLNDDTIQFLDSQTGSAASTSYLTTNAVFRDPSAWYHIVLALDTTQTTNTNRVKLYVNGVQLTAYNSISWPNQDNQLQINTTNSHSIGSTNGNQQFLDGYLAEINFIDGQALSPENFGYFDTIGIWQPRKYSGSYGINGFYLPLNNPNFFELAKDKSGNSNHWTLNGYSSSLASNVVVSDSPVSNYATLNPLFGNTGGTITGGNLTLTHTGGANAKNALGVSSIAMSSGKWYGEVTSITANQASRFGIFSTANTSLLTSANPYIGTAVDGYSAFAGGGTFKENNNITTAITNFGGSQPAAGDVYMVALDLDNNKVWFGRNGSWANNGNPATGTAETFSIPSGQSYYFACNNYTDQQVANFGQRPFAYTAPTGFKTLCTQNLPTPTIKKPSLYFDAVTYTGNGATSQYITSLSFSPDLVWLKSRTDAYDHRLKDSTRGNFALFSNLTNAESAYSLDFLSNGIRTTLGYNDNISSKQYVAWAWDESPIAGMDIVSYTGNGANRTIGHNLGVVPKMIVCKNRIQAIAGGDDTHWCVYHSSVGSGSALFLNLTNAATANTAFWNNTNPTSSVFSIGTSNRNNYNGDNHIAYLFSEVEGFSKFGSYTGNGSADGPFVYCGFRPRFIMIKITNAVETWIIKDTARSIYNGYDVELYPSSSAAEGGPYSPPIMDYLSNGFKLRSNTSGSNASAGTYIFLAFAESPFKYSRAR